MPPPRLILLLFLMAMMSAFVQMLFLPGAGFGAGYENMAVAGNLARDGAFANPFSTGPSGPTAHTAPAYPVLLAGLMRVLGFGRAFVLAVMALTALLYALQAALMPRLAEVLWQDPRPGFLAGWAMVLLPSMRVQPQWETLLLAVCLMLFCVETVRSTRAVTAGLLGGILLLISPAAVIVIAAWLMYLALRRQKSVAYAVVAGLIALAVCVPWTIRNYRTFGAVFFVRDNLGLEIYSGNNDHAEAGFEATMRSGAHAMLHPNASRIQAALMQQMGEYRYYQSLGATAKRWIREHPRRFLQLTIARVREFWLPSLSEVPVYAVPMWLITGASFAGLGFLFRDRQPVAWWILSIWVAFPLIYYLTPANPRYRYPIWWISVLCAGYCCIRFSSNGRE